MRFSRKIIIAIILASGMILAAAGLHYYWPPSRLVRLGDLKWQAVPPLVFVNGEQREQRRGLLVIRVKDAKEQFVAGDWQADYGADGSLLAFGRFPTGYASTAGQHFYLIQAGGVQGTGLDRVQDEVTSAQLNSNGAYLLLGTSTAAGQDFCVLEWKSAVTPDCLRARGERLVKAEWDPASDHQLAALTASGQLLLVDLWEHGLADPKPVTAEAAPALHRRLAALLADRASTPASLAAAGHRSFRTFLGLLLIKDSRGWSVHRRPLGSTLGWLDDGDHLLVKQRDSLGIYEVSSRSYAPLLDEPAVGDRTVGYRNGGDRRL